MDDDEADETPRGVVMPGRHSADRRIRVARPNSAYCRSEGPGTVRAKREAIAPVRRGEKLSTGLRQLVFGRALATDEEGEERLRHRLPRDAGITPTVPVGAPCFSRRSVCRSVAP